MSASVWSIQASESPFGSAGGPLALSSAGIDEEADRSPAGKVKGAPQRGHFVLRPAFSLTVFSRLPHVHVTLIKPSTMESPSNRT
jgi:hypothetical protein